MFSILFNQLSLTAILTNNIEVCYKSDILNADENFWQRSDLEQTPRKYFKAF